MKKIKVGVIGSAGYTGGELLRILINHPHAEIVYAHSLSNAGNKVYEVHNDLFGDTELIFSADFHSNIDVVFLCVGHGDAKKFLAANRFEDSVKIIDLSQDFRLKENQNYQGKRFIYGLPELNREEIRRANYIANPGCFATTIQLALLPLASEGLLSGQVHVHATTGSTGAGQKPAGTTHFSWRNNNLSVYQAFVHRHLQEISESLEQLQPGFLPEQGGTLLERAGQKVNFIPQRGDFARGIFGAIYVASDLNLKTAFDLYQSYYEQHPFTHVSGHDIDLKQVVNTNKALLQLQKQGDKLLILSATDNLIKGASGQAVQNMNLMFGIDETAALRLKPVAF
ncbi:MAG: N-acetyl-gamma-glutamyl-phosphate reductase [Sphingobacterium sp.]